MTLYMPTDTLVFDYDGVIADTERLYWRSWAELLKPRGMAFSWEQYCTYGRGLSDPQMLTSLRQFVEYNSALSGIEGQESQRRQKLRGWCLNQPLISESTIAMLFSLEHYRLGLVTSSARCDVEPMLRRVGIHQCFASLVFGEDVKAHKPYPDPYLLVRQQPGTNLGPAFEDSDAGIASAQQAGFVVMRVNDPDELPLLARRELSS